MGWIQDLREKLRNNKFDSYAKIDRLPIEQRIDFYLPLITKIFTKQHLDPIWGLAIAMQESVFRSTAFAVTGGDEHVGGSYGLMMVSAKTAHALGFTGDPIELCIAPTGILWAAKIIQTNMRDYRINALRDIAATYNDGKRYYDPNLAASTRNIYVPNVLQYASKFRQRNLIR